MKKIDALALMLTNFKCDKKCPFCSPKDKIKFMNLNENFDALDHHLRSFENNRIIFKKFVLTGNGEPSLYSYEKLESIVKVIKRYPNLFDKIRIYTSGNLVFNNKKFNLINSIFNQYNFLILSLNDNLNLELTGSNKNIWKNPNLRKCKEIKLDIALTKFLDINNFIEDLEKRLDEYPNIKKIKIKRLKSQKKIETTQSKWIKENTLDEKQINLLKDIVMKKYKKENDETFTVRKNVTLVFEKENKNTEWIFIQNDKLFNYNEQEITIEELINDKLIKI